MRQPPPGVTFATTQEGFVINTKFGGCAGWILLAFGVFAAGVVVNVARVLPAGRSPLPLISGPVMILFIWAIALTLITGGTVVTKQGDEVRLFVGFKSVGYTRRFRWSDVESIDETSRRTKGGRDYFIRINFKLGTRWRLLFGSRLRAPERAFVLTVLREQLSIVNP